MMIGEEKSWESWEGPALAHLMRRLEECPEEFLREPRIGDQPGVWVDALVGDAVEMLGFERPSYQRLGEFRTKHHLHGDHLKVVQVACWLLGDEELAEGVRRAGEEEMVEGLLRWLEEELYELSAVVMKAEEFVVEGERREELVRRALRAVGARPKGESEAGAAERLVMVDSVERERVLFATRETMRRAAELRRKMAEQRAREAAARYTRE